MDKKKHQIIHALINTVEPITASSLADKISVSTRSVMSYIAEINFYYPNLICSSHDGYTLDRELYRGVAFKKIITVPQTADERINYLLRKILLMPKNDQSDIDLQTFSDEICVSLETTKRDLLTLKHKLRKFDVQVDIYTDCIKLNGDEFAIRSLLNQVIYENFHKTKLCINSIYKIFPYNYIDKFFNLLLNAVQQNHYAINDSLVLNLILDIFIVISRIQRGYILPKCGQKEHSIMPICNEISDIIGKLYGISFNITEKNYLDKILKGYLLPGRFPLLTVDEAYSLLPAVHADALKKIFSYIQQNMSFIQMDNYFCVRFMLNVNNLLYHFSIGYNNFNPQKEDVKDITPFCFKCASKISGELYKLTGFTFTEDDMAYLALHIELNLLAQRDQNIEKVDCGLLITYYFDYDKALMKNVINRFVNDISVSSIVHSEKQLAELKNVQLIISTVPLPVDFPVEWVTTDPFLSPKIVAKIQQSIHFQKLRKKQCSVRNIIQQISSEKLFYHNKMNNHQDLPAIIQNMLHLFIENDYLELQDKNISFDTNSVTVFGHIAVPDFLVKNVRKSGLIIVVNDKPMFFNGEQIHMILILALHPKDWKAIHYAFDVLVNSLDEIKNLRKCLDTQSYQEFIEAVISTIKE